MTPRTYPGEDALDVHLRARIAATRRAALAAICSARWICSDGHRHQRPTTFTARRLSQEVNRRNPRNDWTSSEISLGIYALIDDGTLKHNKDLSLSPR